MVFFGVKLIFTYFLCCWAFFFFQFNETFLLLLHLCKTERWVPQPTWLSPPKQKEVSLQGKVIVHMVTITLSSSGCSQVSLWNHRSGIVEVGWVQCSPGEGGGPPNLSLLLRPLPNLGVPARMEHPPLPLQKEPEGHLAPESWEFLHPRADGSLPQSGAVPCPPKKTQVSLWIASGCIHPSAAPHGLPLWHAAVLPCACLVSGTAVALQRTRKHKTGTGKRLQEEAPWRCCICSISFFSAGILISQLKRTASCRIWFDLLCFLQISQPIITSCCAPGNVYF